MGAVMVITRGLRAAHLIYHTARLNESPAAPKLRERSMAQYRSDLIQTLTSRGFLHQCTNLEALDAKAGGGVITAYTGYDATADSLHIGNLVSIMMLRWLH